jgi:hypothetical protein
MKRFKYRVNFTIQKEGLFSVNAKTEEEAYEKLMNQLEYVEEEELFHLTTKEINIEPEEYEIVEGE